MQRNLFDNLTDSSANSLLSNMNCGTVRSYLALYKRASIADFKNNRMLIYLRLTRLPYLAGTEDANREFTKRTIYIE